MTKKRGNEIKEMQRELEYLHKTQQGFWVCFSSALLLSTSN